MKHLYPICLLSALLLGGTLLQSQTQTDQQLHGLYSHFAGTWIGKHEDYTKTPTLETPLRIEIREDTKKRNLRLEYFYGTKGQKSYDHLVRFMSIDPSASIVTLNWNHDSKEHYKAEPLSELLSQGYGDLKFSGTLLGTLYRGSFHLSPDHLSYFWEKSADSTHFYKTADWTLTREPVVTTGVAP